MKVGTLAVMMLFAQMIHTGPYRKAVGRILNPCAIGAWPMNESSGVTLHDVTANANTATISGTLNVDYFWQSNMGLPGTTVNWGGINGYALTTNTTVTNFDGTTPFSATAWFAAPDAHAYAMMGTLLSASNFKGWSFETKVPGGSSDLVTADFFLVNSYPSNAIDVEATVGGTGVQPATGPPTYFVVTYDGTQKAAGVKFYANGSLLAHSATTADTLTSSTANSTPIRFASRDDGTKAMVGAMAFAEVYNCVLTPTQISTYYASGPGLY